MVPELQYEVKKMVFDSFDTMVETACRIEDVLREHGILTKHGNNNNNSQNNNNSNKDKGKNQYWNKNKQVVNDGVMDSSQHKDQHVLHLSSTVQATKLNTSTQQKSKPSFQGKPKSERCQFTKLGERYGEILQKLIDSNLAHPLDVVHFRILDPKPWWWKEKEFCIFHNGIGHNVENCPRLKHLIQDLIENG